MKLFNRISLLALLFLGCCFTSFHSTEAIPETALNEELKKVLESVNDIHMPLNMDINKMGIKMNMTGLDISKPTFENGVYFMDSNGEMKVNVTGFDIQARLFFDISMGQPWKTDCNMSMEAGNTTITFDVKMEDTICLENSTLNVGFLNFTDDGYLNIFNSTAAKGFLENTFRGLLNTEVAPVLDSSAKDISLDPIVQKALAGEQFTLAKPNMKTIQMTPLVASSFKSGHVLINPISCNTFSMKIDDVGFAIDNEVTAYKVLFWWKKANLPNHIDLQKISIDAQLITRPDPKHKGSYIIDLKQVIVDMPKDTINPSTFNLFGGKKLCVLGLCADEGIAHVTNVILKLSHGFISKMVTKIAQKYVNVDGATVSVRTH
eukprot:Nk52_evm3s160 gene=Nk52_evmTU3s160